MYYKSQTQNELENTKPGTSKTLNLAKSNFETLNLPKDIKPQRLYFIKWVIMYFTQITIK